MTFDKGRYFWPVLPVTKLGSSPKRIEFLGQAVVLFRHDGKIHALADRCPHRGAPLSHGQIATAGLQCPYHGWTFNGQGQCTRVPGLTRECPSAKVVESWLVEESAGFIWLAKEVDAKRIIFTDASALDCLYFYQPVSACLQDILENFLDGFHTHFVHAGWIRKDHGRQRVHATRIAKRASAEVTYSEEGKQNGFFSSFLESSRGISIGRYLAPMGAEIEYRDKLGELSLIASLGVCPAGGGDTGEYGVSLRVATRRYRALPLGLKRWLLSPLIQAVLKQDRQMITAVNANINGKASLTFKPLDTELDLMAPLVRLGLAGEPLNALPDVCVELEL